MKKFDEPSIEIIKYSVQDIITISGDEWVPGENETER